MNTDKIKDFSSLLKDKRNEFNLTQKDISKFVGVAVSTYNNWEQGVNLPNCDKFALLCDCLKVPYSYFIGTSGYEEKTEDEIELLNLYSELSKEDREFVKYIINHELKKKAK